ncbi:20683_t:CDS:2 [Funneliformis geosporum]|nr:20683_t:CDS:2 [Funneliformis geosporum]
MREVQGTGKPDFTCHKKDDDELIMAIEIKRYHILLEEVNNHLSIDHLPVLLEVNNHLSNNQLLNNHLPIPLENKT